MAFAVIDIAAGLSAEEETQALELGPTFVARPEPYEVMLDQAGWDLVDKVDVTPVFARTTAAIAHETEERRNDLVDLLGPEEVDEMATGRRATATGAERGLLKRYLFVSVAG